MRLELESKRWEEFRYYWDDPYYAVRFLKRLTTKPELLGVADWIDFGIAITLGGKCNSQSAYASIPYIVEYAQQCEPEGKKRFSALFLVGNVEAIRQRPETDGIRSFLELEYFRALQIAEKLTLESISIDCWSGNDLGCWFAVLSILRGKFGTAVLHHSSFINHLRCKDCGSYFEFEEYNADILPDDLF